MGNAADTDDEGKKMPTYNILKTCAVKVKIMLSVSLAINGVLKHSQYRD